MASMRDIKRRRSSIQSTGQITKAMKLVSTVKLQKAKTRAENAKSYFNHMLSAAQSLLEKSGDDVTALFYKGKDSGKKAVIYISSNRGLAGGYNSNLLKNFVAGGIKKEDAKIYAVGRKGRDALHRRGYEIADDFSEVINAPLFEDAIEIGEEVYKAYEAGEVGEIWLCYTEFKNTVSHIPHAIKLLPIEKPEEEEETQSKEELTDKLTLMNFEPEAEEALKMIIPKYINAVIFGALVEAVASENGARMQAMDSATSNAEEMISDLTLKFNRARQSSITQEITEIIGGANAIG